MRVVARHLDALDTAAPRSAPPQVAVILLHLGGPASADGIEGFYRRLWQEPVFATGGLSGLFGRGKVDRAWQDAAATLNRGYQLIGARSPVMDLARSQALALENHLNGRPPMAPPDGTGRAVVRAAFRFAEQDIEATLRQLKELGAQCIVAIPLYPQLCADTSALCLAELDRVAAALSLTARLRTITSYHDHPAFLRVLEGRTRRAIDLVPTDLRDEVFLLFAMHSPPYGRAEDGGYLAQVEATAQSVMQAVGYDEQRSAVAFLNCRAPVRFLSPPLAGFAEERAKAGVKAMVVVPVSQVTDAFETLHDLDIEGYQAAVTAGTRQYRRVPTLNADPAFIAALAGLVARAAPEDGPSQRAAHG